MKELSIDDIAEIISRDESRTLEVKESTGEIVKAMAAACAFLNSDGGWVMFGVTPKLKIVGQNVSDPTRQEIARHLRKLEPSIDIPVQYVELPDKPGFYVIAIYFDPNSFTNAPYTYDGRPYYKSENTTALMPRQMYEERLRIGSPERFSWENRPNAEIGMDDLDGNLIFLTLRDGVGNLRIHASAMALQSKDAILSRLNVMNKKGMLLNAANVLFGKEPTRYHIHCKIRLARFEGVDKMVFRDQTVCEGNLFEQYDETINFCRKHLFLPGRMDEKVRVDMPTVPFEVIKEATINMLCHRSWDESNLTPSLAIYDDRMVFQNPGTFPIGFTWEDFRTRWAPCPVIR